MFTNFPLVGLKNPKIKFIDVFMNYLMKHDPKALEWLDAAPWASLATVEINKLIDLCNSTIDKIGTPPKPF